MQNKEDIFSTINIYPVQGHKTIRANGSVVVAGVIRCNFTVREGSNGLFVSFPAQKSKKLDDTTGDPIWYPHMKIVKEGSYDALNKMVVEAYTQKVDGDSGEGTQGDFNDNIPF